MSLRERPVVLAAKLPDERVVDVRVVVPDDPYVERSGIDTVVVELAAGDDVLGVVATPLTADDADRATALAEALRTGLEDGSLEPTADGIEAVALAPPS